MSRRGARLTVAVLFALAAAAAAWQYVEAERALEARRAAAAAFDRETRSVSASILDLRAAQQAYVAVGQGTEYWTARVTTSIGSAKSRIGSLRAQATAADAAARVDAAASGLDDFARMDQRVREYALAGQRLLASDVIFADGFEMSQAVMAELDAARQMQAAAGSKSAAALRRRQHLLAGGTAGIGLFFLLILAFASAPRRAEAATAEGLNLGPVLPEAREVPERLPMSLAEPIQSAVDLPRVADLCLDFARLTDTHQVPVLLERAAALLDASGIVLWIAEPDGRELVATVAHGYDPAALARVGAIPADADNATAAAFRECRTHIVRGDVLTRGAIAVPLVSPGGAVGVMTAEIRREREQHEEVRALAAIVAAQLTTLLHAAPATQPQAQSRAN